MIQFARSRVPLKLARGLAAGLLAGLAVAAAVASQVRLIDLEQLTSRAERIFEGRCTATSTVADPASGQEITVATFEVRRAVKGVTGNAVTVRMLGAAIETPLFRTGDDVVLFLYGDNAQGLTSPVGLAQGRFKVTTDKLGRRLALNDLGNERLLQGVRPAARARLHTMPEPGEVLEADTLLDAAQALAAPEP